MKIFNLILIIIICFALTGCGGETFIAFKDIIPDADLGDEYFDNLIENLSQYINIYDYLILNYMGVDMSDSQDDSQEENLYKIYAESYAEWSEKFPDKVAVIESNIENLYEMSNGLTYDNRVEQFNKMKRVIDSYVSAVYINSPAPEPETSEDNSEVADAPINLNEALENFPQFVSPDFLSKNPAEAVADYLDKNNIKVKKIVFDNIFSKFEQHIYPFRIEYKFKIYYYTGDEEIAENKWKIATIQACYYLGVDENKNYIIEYVSNPALKADTSAE